MSSKSFPDQAGVDKNKKVADMMSGLIDDFHGVKNDIENLETDKDTIQAEIEGLFDKYFPSYKTYTSKGGNKINLIKVLKMAYDGEAVERFLKKYKDKEVIEKAIKKTYIIKDIDGLVEYLKKCNVDPIKFKQFIEVQRKVDNKIIDSYFNDGVLSEKEIKQAIVTAKLTKQLRLG